MRLLKGQLLTIAAEQKCEEIRAIRGDVVQATWGAEIRNYVLHPYKMVKDQRTNWETFDAERFLNGDGGFDKFIGQFLRSKALE